MDIRERIPSVINSDALKVTAVLSVVVILMTAAVAGILSGLGLFVLMMIEMNAIAVVGSSALLATSTTVFLVCYLWLSA